MLKTRQNQLRGHFYSLVTTANRTQEEVFGPKGNIRQISFQPGTHKGPHTLTITSEGRRVLVMHSKFP